jgi:uncharacterized membrane protein YfcA
LLITLAFFLQGLLAAVFAGFLGALMGVGGGIIMVPILSLYMGVPIQVSIAASIASVIATSNAGGSAYLEQRITNVKLAFFLELSTTVGALVGSVVALILNNQVLFLIFGLMLLYLTVVVFRARNIDEQKFASGGFGNAKQDRVTAYLDLKGTYHDVAEKRDVEYKVNGSFPGSIIAFLAGIGSGMLGIGGGVFKVSAMNKYMNVPMKVAVATSKFMIGVTAAVSAITYLAAGKLDFYVLAPVAIGTTVGATMGTWFMNRIKARNLKIVFSIIILYLAYTMLARGLTAWGIFLPYLGGS